MEQSEHLTLTVEEVAAMTGLSTRTIYEKCRTGRLPGALRMDGRWLVKRDILDEWLRSLATVQVEPAVAV